MGALALISKKIQFLNFLKIIYFLKFCKKFKMTLAIL